MPKEHHKSWLVIDSPFNQENAKEIVGLRFEIPPSYTQVQSSTERPHFTNYQEFKDF